MVLKFEDYIKELWSKGINRNMSGEKRLVDKTPFDEYFSKIEWVDMGHPEYLFAKYDYPINNEDKFTLQDIKDFVIPSLPDDVKFMGHSELKFLNRYCENFMYQNQNNEIYKTLDGRHNEVHVHLKTKYFVEFKGDYVVFIQNKELFKPKTTVSFKLIKRKLLDELWSKGVERNLSGEKRLEDINEFDKYIDDIEWVDMGHPKYLFAKFDYENYFNIKDIEDIIKTLPKNIKIAGKKEFDYLTNNFRYFTDYIPKTDSYMFKYISPDKRNTVCCKMEKFITGGVYFNKIISLADNEVKIRFYEFIKYKSPHTSTTEVIYTSTAKYFSIKLIKEK